MVTMCSKCQEKRSFKDGFCYKCWREEHPGKMPYESMTAQGTRSRIKKHKEEERDRCSASYPSFIKDKPIDPHIISVLCLASREINRVFERYICCKEIDDYSCEQIIEALIKVRKNGGKQ